jgi:hypothetical protein
MRARLCFLLAALIFLSSASLGQINRGTLSGRGSVSKPGGGGGALAANAGADRAILVNEPLSLDGSASVGAFDGLQTNGKHSIQWDFGFGSWDYEGSLIAPVAYPAVGVYTVTLTIFDAGGASSSDQATVTVSAITLGSEETLTDTGNTATNRTNLQAAIDNSTGTNNKVITIPAGWVSSGTIVLKHRTVANYCTIRTANHALLPNGVSRAGAADAANMFVLEVSSSVEIIDTPTASSTPARYYNIIGAHLRKASPTLSYTHTFVQTGHGTIDALSKMPDHLIFDRCYFDGGSNVSSTLRGISIRANDIAVVNSTFVKFKGVGLETQAVLALMGERINLMNNFMEAACENFMSGGGDPSVSGHVPTDLVFRRNLLEKDLGWRSGDAAYYGTDMSVKNIFELKVANRFSIQGNVMTEHWIEDQNWAVTITVRNQDNTAPWSVIQLVDFSYNKVHKFANAMSISGTDNINPSQQTNRVIVRHNTFTGHSFYSGQNAQWLPGATDRLYLVRNSIDLNVDPLTGQGRLLGWEGVTGCTNFHLIGNIGQGYINHDSGTGTTAMAAACSGTSYTVIKNGFYRSRGTNPPDNSSVSLIADVKFTNLAAFDLSLAGDSPFLTTGPAGGPAGADVSKLNTLIANVETGAW